MGVLLLVSAFFIASTKTPQKEPIKMPVVQKEFALKAEEIDVPTVLEVDVLKGHERKF